MVLCRLPPFRAAGGSAEIEVRIEIFISNGSTNSPDDVGIVSKELLCALQCGSGQIAWLTTASASDEYVAVRLQLQEANDDRLSRAVQPDFPRAEKTAPHRRDHLTRMECIRVSNGAATNLGMISKVAPLSSSLRTFESTTGTVRLLPAVGAAAAAASVTLRVWGALVVKSNDDDKDDDWPLPPHGTVLQNSCLVQVDRRDDGEQFVYEVVNLEPVAAAGGTHSGKMVGNSINVCVSCRETRYTLERAPIMRWCPQLPPLRIAVDPTSNEPPHPDVPQFCAFFRSLKSSAIDERILHVVASPQEHDIGIALRTSAARVGRRYLHVHGLAAYAYRNRRNNKSNNIITGGLVDQLEGLRAALECSQRHAPSILHLQGLDEEWPRKDDAEMRTDAQMRMWNLMVQVLAATGNGDDQEKESVKRNSRCVPSVLVVITTSRALDSGSGVLSERLVYESLEGTRPDLAYIEYLWRHVVVETLIPESQLPLLYEHLSGRPLHEIVQLREAFHEIHKKQNRPTRHGHAMNPIVEDGDEEETLDDIMKRLCTHLDRTRRQQSGAPKIPSVHWEDVGGLDHVRREVMETIELPLKYPHLLRRQRETDPGSFCNSTGRSGILLYGPPGTGKTLVAKAVATECRLPFLSVKGPELLGSFVGESESQLRAIFAQASRLAAQNTPHAACVLFFDELDSLAPRRGEQANGGGSVMDRVVATLLGELDRASSANQQEDGGMIFCMGATNRPDMLDPALLRPGRLDRLVYLGVSTNRNDQAKILAAQLRKSPLESGDPLSLSTEVVDVLPLNVTGADLSAVVTEAQAMATLRLCEKADEELLSRQSGGEDIDLDTLLSTWSCEQLVPKITVGDLRTAALQIVPSISDEELLHYRQLHERLSNA